MKRIVLYYSKTDSNRYLANRIANELNCEIEEIKPIFNSILSIIFSSLLEMKIPVKKFSHEIKLYDEIILCGPIMMGRIISPLLTIIKKYNSNYSKLYFVTCCGGSDEVKDDKFGYNLVFTKIRKLTKDKCMECVAFPIVLAVPEDKRNDDQAIMNTKLNDSNFNGELIARFNSLLSKLKSY